MEDKKAPNSEQIRLRRVTELREFALAAFYPLTHSGDAVHLKRTENAQRSPDEPKPWKKPWDK
jgi:hypothetical protein